MNAPVGEADGIEEGKRLIRAGGETLSLAERVTDRINRLTWGTPLHAFRLRGRHPLKLIAVIDDAVPGDPARGQALFDGRVSFRGQTLGFDEFSRDKMAAVPELAEHVHAFATLRDLSTVAPRARAAPIAESLMRAWLEGFADKVAEPAWRADLVGRRILFWCAHAPLILSSSDLVYRSRVLNTLARQARHLERTADKVPMGSPRIAAWCGIVAAHLLLPGYDSRRGAAESGLARALAGSIFDDGGVVSRAPVAQLEAVNHLTLLAAAYAARRLEPPALVSSVLARMVPALLGVCLGDRGLGSWQGGAPTGGDGVDAVVEASGVRTRPLRQAREWGYQRLAAGQVAVVMDAAPPPVARLVEGGCASTLAVEISDGAHRLIVNCGGASGMVAGMPPGLPDALRTTAAHSTLTLGDSNSTAIHPDGTLGRGVAEVELARQETEHASRIEGSHDGYARRFGFTHRRQLLLTGDGGELRGEDTLIPVGRKRGRGGVVAFAARFHLGAGVEAAPTADGQAALLRLPGGGIWQFRCRGGALTIEDSLWINGEGQPVGTHQLVVSGEAPAGGSQLGWLLKRAR